MKKVCIFTATRSEYGLLRWLIDEINNDTSLELQLVVTGSHLSHEYGNTYKEIESDGYKIDEKLEILLSTSTATGIIKSMGLCSIGVADVLKRLLPDVIVVLGDRYELLPICSAALIMNVPIAHISGGDITEGAIDDQIRNAITMMATLHFPGVRKSAKRIEKMLGTKKNIYVVGEPGLDNFTKLTLWSRDKLAKETGLETVKKWVLLTYHPETKLTIEDNLTRAANIIKALSQFDELQIIITGANADLGGIKINQYLQNIAADEPNKFKFYSSLGQLRYMSLMKEVSFIIGNSSSGIVEAPFLGKSVINIGDRQKGRYMAQCISNINTSDAETIGKAIEQVLTTVYSPNYYFGEGDTSSNIKEILKIFLYNPKELK